MNKSAWKLAFCLLLLARPCMCASPCSSHYALESWTEKEWRVVCASSKKSTSFPTHSLYELTLTAGNSVRPMPPFNSMASPTHIALPSPLNIIGDLYSAEVTSLSIQSQANYAIDQPVYIKTEAFAQLAVLRSLEVSSVPFYFPNTTLVLPSSLQELKLSNVGLENLNIGIRDGSSASLSPIEKLDLSQNNLTSIPLVSFALAETLTILNLTQNRLEEVTVRDNGDLWWLSHWINDGILITDDEFGSKEPSCRLGQVVQLPYGSKSINVCVQDASDMSNMQHLLYNSSDSSTDSSVEKENRSSIHKQDAIGDLNDASFSSASESGIANLGLSDNFAGSTIITIVTIIGLAVIVSIVGCFFFQRKKKRHAVEVGACSDFNGLTSFDRPDRVRKGDRYENSTMGTTTIGDGSVVMRSGSMDSGPFFRSADTTLDHTRETTYCSVMESQHQNGDSFSMKLSTDHACKRGDSRGKFSTLVSPQAKSSVQPSSTVFQWAYSSQESMHAYSEEEGGEMESDTGRDRLKEVLIQMQESGKESACMQIGDHTYMCDGALIDTTHGIRMKCKQVDEASGVMLNLILKFFPAKGMTVMMEEYQALQTLQTTRSERSTSLRSILAKEVLACPLVETAMEITLADGVQCGVLVMEAPPSDAVPLVQWIEENEGTIPRLQLVHALLRALERFESLHIVHGGMNENNMFVRESESHDGETSISILFGCLEQAASTDSHLHRSACDKLLVESIHWMAPELAQLAMGKRDKLRASSSLDIWSFGMAILQIYAGYRVSLVNDLAKDFTVKVALDRLANLDSFSLEDWINRQLDDGEIKELARLCLASCPLERPTIDELLRLPIFAPLRKRTKERSDTCSTVSSCDLTSTRQQPRSTRRGCRMPPSLWLIFPPQEYSLEDERSTEEWVTILSSSTLVQDTENGRFPLHFVCEHTGQYGTASPCTSALSSSSYTGFAIPFRLFSLVKPLVQEAKLFLGAKATLTGKTVGELSGLGQVQWRTLEAFYDAIERLKLAPVSSLAQARLAPLEEMISKGDSDLANQVLDEIKCLAFSKEKRRHVQSLLEVVHITQELRNTNTEPSQTASQIDVVRQLTTQLSTEDSFGQLQRIKVQGTNATRLARTRWMCAAHWNQTT